MHIKSFLLLFVFCTLSMLACGMELTEDGMRDAENDEEVVKMYVEIGALEAFRFSKFEHAIVKTGNGYLMHSHLKFPLPGSQDDSKVAMLTEDVVTILKGAVKFTEIEDKAQMSEGSETRALFARYCDSIEGKAHPTVSYGELIEELSEPVTALWIERAMFDQYLKSDKYRLKYLRRLLAVPHRLVRNAMIRAALISTPKDSNYPPIQEFIWHARQRFTFFDKHIALPEAARLKYVTGQ